MALNRDSYLVLPEIFAYTLGFAFGRYNPDKAEQDAYGASYDLQAERLQQARGIRRNDRRHCPHSNAWNEVWLVVDAKLQPIRHRLRSILIHNFYI